MGGTSCLTLAKRLLADGDIVDGVCMAEWLIIWRGQQVDDDMARMMDETHLSSSVFCR